MKKVNKELHEKYQAEAIEGVEALLQDRSVPIETTLKSMEELRYIIACHIDGLKLDIKLKQGKKS